jgi:hypothetical protein
LLCFTRTQLVRNSHHFIDPSRQVPQVLLTHILYRSETN